MTDIVTTAPIAFRRTGWPSLTLHGRRVGVALLATFAAVGQAFAMAYAAPFSPRPSPAVDTDLQGRDPNW